jgi:predicted nucleic acid-binding protein
MSTFYFDSSAIVKLYLRETGSRWVDQIYTNRDQTGSLTHQIAISKIGIVEVAAAISRRQRMGAITAEMQQKLFTLFIRDSNKRLRLLGITDSTIQLAAALTQRSSLRGCDAINLAAALILNQERIEAGLPPVIFVSADHSLCESAITEGLIAENPNYYP